MELYNKDAYLLRLECIMVTLHSMLVRIQLYEVSYQDIEMTVFVLMRDGE